MYTLRNTDIRNKAKAAGVRLWQIVSELCLADGAFSKKLREELPQAEKAKIIKIIEKLRVGG